MVAALDQNVESAVFLSDGNKGFTPQGFLSAPGRSSRIFTLKRVPLEKCRYLGFHDLALHKQAWITIG